VFVMLRPNNQILDWAVKKLNNDQRSSLFCQSINGKEKKRFVASTRPLSWVNRAAFILGQLTYLVNTGLLMVRRLLVEKHFVESHLADRHLTDALLIAIWSTVDWSTSLYAH
jgi:hypothetical protein